MLFGFNYFTAFPITQGQYLWILAIYNFVFSKSVSCLWSCGVPYVLWNLILMQQLVCQLLLWFC